MDAGIYTSATEISEAEGINKSYVSRILRLTLLAPDIVETVMDGCPVPRPAELMQPFPVSCERQRAQFC
jgi:hypothetical protein